MNEATAVYYGALIGASAAIIGGIVAGIFTLLSNSLNHRAELSKIAFERRLVAFQEIYKGVRKTNRVISEYLDLCRERRGESEIISPVQSYETRKASGIVGVFGDKSALQNQSTAKTYYSFSKCADEFEELYSEHIIYTNEKIEDLVGRYRNVLDDTMTRKEEVQIEGQLEEMLTLLDNTADDVLTQIQEFIEKRRG